MWGRGGVLIERRAPRQAARAGNAAAFSLSLLSPIGSHSVSGILVGWDQLPLCTPAASVCQPVDPSPLLA